MRIGFVSIIFEPWGGSEELWAAAAHEMINRGHEVVISAVDTGSIAPKMKALTERGAKLFLKRGFIQPGLPFNRRAPKKVLNFMLNKVINPYGSFFASNPEIVVYTGAADSLANDPYFLKLVYQKKTPLIIINQVNYEYVRMFFEHDSAVLRKAFHYASKNLFVSERNKEVMERFLADSIPNSQVVRNPVNLSSAETIPYPETNMAELAMVANLLINHKGQDIALDVLRREKWMKRNWRLNIYGSGLDEVYLRRLTKFYRLEDRVFFHGRVNDIQHVWRENHLLLMPSRLEGTPLALVEAMLCGRAAVATDVGGHAEWIDASNGFLADGANVNSFDKALENAWEQKDKWKAMGLAARKKALSQFDPAPGKTLADIICQSTTS